MIRVRKMTVSGRICLDPNSLPLESFFEMLSSIELLVWEHTRQTHTLTPFLDFLFECNGFKLTDWENDPSGWVS